MTSRARSRRADPRSHEPPPNPAFCAPLLAALAVALLAHTAAAAVLEPPRVDLSRFGTLGLVEFESGAVDGFGAEVSREYLAAMPAAQPGTPVLELGSQRQVLPQVGASGFDPEAVARARREVLRRRAGRRRARRAAGRAEASRSTPPAQWITASAVLEGSLHVRILDTHTGATLWSNLSRAREEVARMNVTGAGVSGVGATPPDEARQRLVERMVQRSTDDFWAHWR